MSYSRLRDSVTPSNIPMMMKLPTSWTTERTQPASISAARRTKLIFSYAPDWLITIFLSALFYSLNKVKGFRQEFSLEDKSISHPFAVHERVPVLALYLIAFVAPLVIMPIINFFTIRSWWDLHNSSLGLILGLALTGSLTQIVKVTVGRPRPDLLDRCHPPPGSSDPLHGLSNSTICTSTHLLEDGFRSFFSGHSSLSFAGMGFLAFYLAGKLHLFDERGHAGKAWLSLTPLVAASLVAISRTMDYRHHWQDVTVGTIVGLVFSFFAYRQYYPALSSPLSHRPYSPRIARTDGGHIILPTHTANSSVSVLAGNVSSSYQGGNQGYDPGSSYSDTAYTGGGTQHIHRQDSYPEGTVPRPRPDSLEEVWKDGEGEPLGYLQAPPRAGPSAPRGA